MPWIETPASLYVREEVVVHRIDNPLLVRKQDPTSRHEFIVTYEIWELRLHYLFDAAKGQWDFDRYQAFGYRQNGRSTGPRMEVDAMHPDYRELANYYAPRWIPDPAKPKASA